MAGGVNYIVSSDLTDTYTAQLDIDLTEYIAGMTVMLKVATANTGACSLNINGLGVKNIKTVDGNNPADNDILTTGVAILIYNGTNFILVNPATTCS